MSYIKSALLLLLIIANTIVYSEESPLCQSIANFAPTYPTLPDIELKDDKVYLFSDHAIVRENEGLSEFYGDVLMKRAGQTAQAHAMFYDWNKNIVNTDVDVTLWQKEFVVQAKGLKLRPQHEGEMKNAAYWLLEQRGHGQAETLIQHNRHMIELENSTYSTCNPDEPNWYLQARETILDKKAGIGKVYGAKIYFFDIPIFYSPYLSFPLQEQRKTGFLSPTIGSSDETGIETTTPFYWNIMPNMDATFTPRFMTRRGVLLNTEFRYLLNSGSGLLEAEYINHDNAYGDKRALAQFRHAGYFSPRWMTDITFNYASDDRYFEELGHSLETSSITHLEKRADLYYLGDGWLGLGRLHAFQTLDRNPAARPYHRLPQFIFKTNLPELNNQLNYTGQLELVRFDRNTDVTTGPVGNRADLKLAMSYPMRTAGTFIVPRLSLRHTSYGLEELNESYTKSSPNRNLLTASVDSGLFFDRQTNLFDTPLLHTLEPRLFYRYTPHEDQSDIPIFDSAEYDLSFNQLFRHNNFAGADRVDDAHQISLGLTTRLLETENGRERLRASLGQIYYFNDREVTLPGQMIDSDASSSIVAEVASQFTKTWSASAVGRWNPHDNDTEHTVFRARYRYDKENLANFSYRLREGKLEQTDISFYYSLHSRWNVLGRWQYSLEHETELETFGGIEYKTCCWSVRGIVRRYLNTIEQGDYSNGFYVQFELKGLGTVGRKADILLEHSIPGYQDRF